jgi:hypothetical protein
MGGMGGCLSWNRWDLCADIELDDGIFLLFWKDLFGRGWIERVLDK